MMRSLGTCYYPEHWPRELWKTDAARMKALGLSWVRIGEFAWSRLEPRSGAYDFAWLDDAIAILGEAGLKVVLGTPTATPPRWMLDRHPDMLALDANGRPRNFGSRRHYCFSHEGYKASCATIVSKLAERYGHHPFVAAWQTDNEYGCHDTALSYSESARDAFQVWLEKRYGSIDALNAAWGQVFWSMAYTRFDQIDLPNLTVTTANPAHVLSYRRFSSDQIVAFNRTQVDIIRGHSDAPIAHNYMGRITDFDHHALGADLDFAAWDSYPLGFLEDRVGADNKHKLAFARQGDPDFQAFHHDLYRGVGRTRFWVMEQQPGPVNWAPYNPAPLLGMVRLWTWEAFAHGAEAVLYFRWRQLPFAQEQMHAGLLRPDGAETQAIHEVRQIAQGISETPQIQPSQAPVALIFDYEAQWAWDSAPHGQNLTYFSLVFDLYRAMRSLGLSIDIVPPHTSDFGDYKLIAVPGLIHMNQNLKHNLSKANAQIIYGPRTDARNADMAMPLPMPPNLPDLNVTVSRVESLRPDAPLPLAGGGTIAGYREELETPERATLSTQAGEAVAVTSGTLTYCGAWLDRQGWRRLLAKPCQRAGIKTIDLPEGVRIRDNAAERFWFNYGTEEQTVEERKLPPASVLRQTR